MDYRVELDVYNGPLDLLLYLIKRDELDIYDIPIRRITDTYMSYVGMLQQLTKEQGLDINVAGDFLVMAATLMEIKSAMLLPRQEAEGDQASVAAELTDPRYELVQQLLEYKRYKDAASALGQRHAVHQQRYARYPAKLPGQSGDEPPPLDMDEVQIWDLLDTFSRLMREVGQRTRIHEVVYDDTPIDLHAADIEDRLRRELKLTLRQLLVGRRSRSEMIGVFLALLELIREKKILVVQKDDLSDLEITPAPPEMRESQLPMHLSADDDSAETAREGEAPAEPPTATGTEEPKPDPAPTAVDDQDPHANTLPEYAETGMEEKAQPSADEPSQTLLDPASTVLEPDEPAAHGDCETHTPPPSDTPEP